MHCTIRLPGGLVVWVAGNQLTGGIDFRGLAQTDPRGVVDVRAVSPDLARVGETWVERNQAACRRALQVMT